MNNADLVVRILKVAGIRHGFGARAVGEDSAEGLERELRKALAADGPTIIEARVYATHYSQTVFD